VATQLEGIGIYGGSGMSKTDYPVILRNRSASACSLEGYADVSILSASGMVLARAAGTIGRGTYFADGPVGTFLMQRGTSSLVGNPPSNYRGVLGQAYMNIEWYDCLHRQASSLVLTLPSGGGNLSVPFAFQGPDSPACPNPAWAGSFYLGRGPLTPSGVDWSMQRQYLDVTIRIDAPATVHRGSVLTYTVTLNNRSNQDYSLATCPDYNEIVVPFKEAGAQYQLNCSPVGTIAAGRSATFAMRLEIPENAPTGATQIEWSLLDGRLNPAFAFAPIEIL
jgi:hypothetical protein